jgi:copper chaperone CopZ
MNSLKKIMIAILLLLSVVVSNAQIKNAKIESVKIYGNCGMCEAKIEKAGSLKNVANVDWNADTKMAVLTYDPKITTQDEILKRIALSGYDSDKFLAPEVAYSKLSICCQYDRVTKNPVKLDAISGADKSEHLEMDMSNHSKTTENQLKSVLDNYFLLKDALVKTDAKTASEKATALLSSITAVKMETLKMDEHVVWMKILKDLTADSKSISETQDIKKQRETFKSLSKNIYELIKVSKPSETIYYQYCPMQDANWLSKENAVKNPYYGSQMLSCGKTIETIK